MQSNSSGSNNQTGTNQEPEQGLGDFLTDPAGLGRKVSDAFSSNFNIKNVLNAMGEIDKSAMDVVKTFGVGKESVESIKAALVGARDGVFLLGGNWADLVKTQQEAAAATGRNITLNADAQKELFAANKVTGLAVSSIVSGFKDVGISALDAGKKVGEVVNAARQAGVSAQAVSKMAFDNMSKMNMYNFKDGVEGLSRMAAHATSMRIDMKEILNVAEKAFNPEGAIKMAAELQRLGVTQSELLDPLNLMNMAENDPEELQKQIAQMSKQFVQLNKDGQFEILPGAKRQMREIEKSLGMAPGSLSKMALASAEVEEKMKRIKFPDFVSEDQKKYLANIAEMKDGKMMIEVNGESMELDKAIAQAGNQDGIKKLLEATEKKDIVDIAEDQLNVLDDIRIGLSIPKGKTGAALSATKTGEKIVRGAGKTTKETGIDVANLLGGSTAELTKYLRKNVDKQKDFDLTKIVDLFKGLVKEEDKTKIKDRAKDLLNITVSFDYDRFGDSVLTALKKWTKIGNDVLITPDGAIKFNPEDTILAGTGLDVISKMLENPKANVQGAMVQNTVTEMANKKPETISSEKKSGTNEGKIDITIKIDAPPQIDTETIKKTVKDTLFVQEFIGKMKEVSSNFNLT